MFRFGHFAAVLVGTWLCTSFSPAQAEVLITIDKATQQMTVEVDGTRRWVWPVSTGRKSYETPAGNFQPFRMVADHYSKEWDEAPMPHSIFFTESGHAIHGSFETGRLGRRASHGCVRLSTKNASKLYALVQRQGLANSRVVVLPDPNAPIMAKSKTPPTEHARKAPALPATTAPMPANAAGFSITPAAGQAYGYVPTLPAAVPPQQPAFALPVAPPPQWQTIPHGLN